MSNSAPRALCENHDDDDNRCRRVWRYKLQKGPNTLRLCEEHRTEAGAGWAIVATNEPKGRRSAAGTAPGKHFDGTGPCRFDFGETCVYCNARRK